MTRALGSRSFGPRLVGAVGVWTVLQLVAATLAAAQRDAPRREEITTATWREPEVPFEPHWELLRVPELAMRLLTTPLFPAVALVERHRLDLRAYDLLTNDERTALALPVVTVATGDGYGFGVSYSHSDAFRGEERLKLNGVLKSNGDYRLGFALRGKITSLDGRSLGAELDCELDQNARFYGIGGDSKRSDLRLLEIATIGSRADFELGGPATDLASFGSDIHLGYLRERIRSGRGSGVGAGAEGDPVEPPPGFDEALDYAAATWTFRHDLRDSSGRTSRGTLLELDLTATSDLNGAERSAATIATSAAWFVAVAPRHRVLMVSAGATGSVPWTHDADVPLHALATLGRDTVLRGYAEGRFRDHAAIWSSIEYRYPIYEFRDTGLGLSSTLFLDVGRVGSGARELFQPPLRTSYGFGVRGETSSAFIFRAQVGFSEEGAQALFSLNDVP